MFLGVAFFISGKLAIAAGIIGIVSMLPLKLIAKRAVLYGNKISEINEKIQNESIYDWLDSKTDRQKKGIVDYIQTTKD